MKKIPSDFAIKNMMSVLYTIVGKINEFFIIQKTNS